MTTFIGDSNQGDFAYATPGLMQGSLGEHVQGFTAADYAWINTLSINVLDHWTATNTKITLRDSTGTLIASGAVTTTVNGVNSVSITPVFINKNATYYMGVVHSGYIKLYSTATQYQTKDFVGSQTASVATTINFPGAGTSPNNLFQIYATGTAAAAIVSVNSGNPVEAGSVGNTLEVLNNAFTPTSITVGTLAATNIAGTYPSFTFDLPGYTDNTLNQAFGSVTLLAHSSAEDTTTTVQYVPTGVYDYVTLAGTLDTSSAASVIIGLSPAAAVGDEILFDSTHMTVTPTGVGQSTLTGTQTLWQRSITDGKIRSYTLTTGTGADTTPDAFTFTAVTGAGLSGVNTSNTITVAGIDVGQNVPISIAGGTYSKNGGAYTSVTGTVAVGDTVAVRVTSSGSYSTAAATTLTISGVTSTYTVTTRAADTTPNAFTFTAATSVELSTATESSTFTLAGIDSDVTTTISVTGGMYAVSTDGGTTFAAYTSSAGTVALGNVIKVKGTSSASFATTTNVALTVGGVSSSFAITSRAADLTPDAFSFTTINSATISTIYESNTITIAGVDAGQDVAVTVTGTLQYSVNTGSGFGAFTSSAGVVRLGHIVKVRLTASGSVSTAVSGTLIVGGVSGSFTVSTGIADTTPDAFVFTAVTGATFSTVYTSNAVTIAGVTAATGVPISITGGTYKINSGSYTSASGSVFLGDTVTVKATTAGTVNTATSADVTIGGVTGSYLVTTATTADSTPDAFSFPDVVNATVFGTYQSAAVVVAGTTSGLDVPISVTNGAYAIDSGGGYGSFVTTPGVIRLGYSVKLRVTASGSAGTSVSTQLNIGGVINGFTVTTVDAIPADTTPDAFSFVQQTAVPKNVPVISNVITVVGVDAGINIPITVNNSGQYSVNNGAGWSAFTALDGTVRLGSLVRVQVTTSTGALTDSTTTVSIGGVSSTFVTTTADWDTTPIPFQFDSVIEATRGATITSNEITVSGVDAGHDVTISVSGCSYAIDSGSGYGSFGTTSGVVRLGYKVKLRNTASSTIATPLVGTILLGTYSTTWTVTSNSLLDNEPDAVVFTPVTGSALLSYVTSNAVTIAGVEVGALTPISVLGGEYAVNRASAGYGAWTSQSGTVILGDLIKVRILTSGGGLVARTATLKLASGSYGFTATTVVDNTDYSTGGDPVAGASPVAASSILNRYVKGIEIAGKTF